MEGVYCQRVGQNRRHVGILHTEAHLPIPTEITGVMLIICNFISERFEICQNIVT